MVSSVEDIDVTQESVNDFFDEIDTQALADSLRMSRNNTAVAVKDNCEYCSANRDNKPLIDHSKYLYGGVAGEPDLGITAWINKGQLIVETDTDYQVRKIHFCPMCGEEFEEEE